MFRRLGYILVLLALFTIARGHWVLLQGVAWGQMLVEYSREEADLITGMKKTFDGAHPCQMCVKLEVERNEDRQEQQEDPLKKVDLKDLKLRSGTASVNLLHPWGGVIAHSPAAAQWWSARAALPEVPPPRV